MIVTPKCLLFNETRKKYFKWKLTGCYVTRTLLHLREKQLELNADKNFCASSPGVIFIIPFVNMKIVMKPILLHFATCYCRAWWPTWKRKRNELLVPQICSSAEEKKSCFNKMAWLNGSSCKFFDDWTKCLSGRHRDCANKKKIVNKLFANIKQN